MSYPHISLNELYSIKKKKDSNCINTYNVILEKCHKKIKNIANAGGMKTFFEVPYFILGLPLYDINNCIEYIIKCLRKNGMLAQSLSKPNNNILYISWDINDIDNKYKEKLLLH